MGACKLESGDAVPAAIPIRKMTIGIAQTLDITNAKAMDPNIAKEFASYGVR
jgi:hypothetical protein